MFIYDRVISSLDPTSSSLRTWKSLLNLTVIKTTPLIKSLEHNLLSFTHLNETTGGVGDEDDVFDELRHTRTEVYKLIRALRNPFLQITCK